MSPHRQTPHLAWDDLTPIRRPHKIITAAIVIVCATFCAHLLDAVKNARWSNATPGKIFGSANL